MIKKEKSGSTYKNTALLTALFLFLFAAFQAALVQVTRADEALWKTFLGGGGTVLLMRHALAPGIGDPDNFSVEDCATQRNLSDQGRAQARDTGNLMRKRNGGAFEVKLYSSQWCRCRETAELLGLGAPTEISALNSLYGRPQNRERQMSALKRLISALKEDSLPHVMVTHSVTIRALTGRSTVSGGMVLVKSDGAGGITVLGQIGAVPLP